MSRFSKILVLTLLVVVIVAGVGSIPASAGPSSGGTPPTDPRTWPARRSTECTTPLWCVPAGLAVSTGGTLGVLGAASSGQPHLAVGIGATAVATEVVIIDRCAKKSKCVPKPPKWRH